MKKILQLLFLLVANHSCTSNFLRKEPINIYSIKNGLIYFQNQPVNISGVSWSGLNTEMKTMNGLWKNSIDYYIDHLSFHNVNTIQIPFSMQNVLLNNESKPLSSLVTVEYQNKTSMDILDLVFQKAFESNMFVIIYLDRERNTFKNLYFYENHNDIISTLKIIIHRYEKYKNFLGINLYCGPEYGNSILYEHCLSMIINEIDTLYPNRFIYLIQGLNGGQEFQNFSKSFLNEHAHEIILAPQIIDKTFTQNLDIQKTLVNDLFIEWNFNFANLPNNISIMPTYLISSNSYFINILGDFLSRNKITNTIFWDVSVDPFIGVLENDWNTFKEYRWLLLKKIQPFPTKLKF